MTKRYQIAVCRKSERIGYGQPGPTIETVARVLRAEQIGNFNPLFCTYRGNRRVLVQSLAGDVSDPFRRDDSYAKSFYIEI